MDVNPKVGAFLDWGLEKDILLPFREQKKRVQVGSKSIVYLRDSIRDRSLDRHRPIPSLSGSIRASLSKRRSRQLTRNRRNAYRLQSDNRKRPYWFLYKSTIDRFLNTDNPFPGIHQRRSRGRKIDLQIAMSGYRLNLGCLPRTSMIKPREAGGYLPSTTSPHRSRFEKPFPPAKSPQASLGYVV